MPIEQIPTAAYQFNVVVQVMPDGSIDASLGAQTLKGPQPPQNVLMGLLVRALGEIMMAPQPDPEAPSILLPN